MVDSVLSFTVIFFGYPHPDLKERGNSWRAADKTEVLPESVLFEILSANPDELKKDELIKYLEDKQNPLPQYMVDILKQVATGTSYKTVLENQLAYFGSDMTRAIYDMLRSNLSDTVENTSDFRNWLNKLEGVGATYQLVSSYVHDGDFSTALSIAGNIPSMFELDSGQMAEHDYYMEMLDFYNNLNQQGRGVFQLDANEVANLVGIADNSVGIAGAYAKNILSFAYGYDYCDCPYVSGSDGLKSSSAIEMDKGDRDVFGLSTAPNPASDWVAFNFTLPPATDVAQISISNANGKTVKVISIDKSSGQVIWDTRDVGSGIYFYKVLANGMSKSGKLIINK